MPSVSVMTTQTVAGGCKKRKHIQNALAGFTVINRVRSICLNGNTLFWIVYNITQKKKKNTHAHFLMRQEYCKQEEKAAN